MNYKHIENLVTLAKDDNKEAKEELIKEFKPMILNIAQTTFIDGYDFFDLKNECYMTLLKCIKMYNSHNHRFVAYATNSIKNNINYIVRKSIKRSSSEGNEALTLTDNLEHTLLSDMDPIDDIIISNLNLNNLLDKLNTLSHEEKNLINHVYINNSPISLYAYKQNISYPTALYKKNMIIKKLKSLL